MVALHRRMMVRLANRERELTKRLDGYRLLVIEDEFMILLDLQHMLESEGASVVTATSVDEGMKAIDDYCAAILDVRLPDGEVFPVAQELSRRNVPLGFCSGHAQEEIIHGRFPDAVALSKPAPERVLIESVMRQAARAHAGIFNGREA